MESSAERVSHETREQSREDKGEDGERKRPPPLRAKEKESITNYRHLNYNSHCVIVLYRLSDCGVTDEGCAALASDLRSNPSHLRQLSLSGDKIGDLGVKRLCAVLKNPDCKLEILW